MSLSYTGLIARCVDWPSSLESAVTSDNMAMTSLGALHSCSQGYRTHSYHGSAKIVS